MKPNEIIFRQNRVVYVLMTLLALVGIVWGIREHRRHTAIPEAGWRGRYSYGCGSAAALGIGAAAWLARVSELRGQVSPFSTW